MAWRCTGKTNAQLIANMKINGIFHSDRVMMAMNATDRGNYVPKQASPYEDAPQLRISVMCTAPNQTQYIGHGATISAPHMHAYAAEHLLPYLHPGAKVLDIGSGSGYLVAVLHELISPGGKVVGIDHVSELVDSSLENLSKDGHGDAIANGEIVMIAGDGRLGYPEGGPFDVIHVGAASPGNTVPHILIEQLARPGRIFIPVGDSIQYIEQVDKDIDGHIQQKRIMGVRYIPLTDRDTQLQNT